VEAELLLQLKDDDNAQRLLAIPGIGAITASCWPLSWVMPSIFALAVTLPHRWD